MCNTSERKGAYTKSSEESKEAHSFAEAGYRSVPVSTLTPHIHYVDPLHWLCVSCAWKIGQLCARVCVPTFLTHSLSLSREQQLSALAPPFSARLRAQQNAPRTHSSRSARRRTRVIPRVSVGSCSSSLLGGAFCRRSYLGASIHTLDWVRGCVFECVCV